MALLYLISGASASGKKTVARAVAGALPRLEAHHDNEKLSLTGAERVENVNAWIEDALELERRGVDLVLATQSPLGEILAARKAPELEGIAPLLLDCQDPVRMPRLIGRGVDPRWPIGMDTFCWAVFHRLHAADPRWEQRVLLDTLRDGPAWERWTDWSSDDPRWCVRIHDNTHEELQQTTAAVVTWIESVRAGGTPLSREHEWWGAGGED